MLKTLIIDDEEDATESLQLMIEKFIPEIGQVFVCNDARLAPEMIHKQQPELVFLDIRMPYLNGFDVLNKIPGKKFKIIFTTAYNEYAIKAIRFSAFDYLLKPIDIEDLIHSVKRLLQSGDDYNQQHELISNVIHNMQTPGSEPFRLALSTKEGVRFLMPYEIMHCEAVGNYTKFYVAGNKPFVISKTLGEYEELLAPYHFIRTHKSHLVNRAFISFLDHDGFIILKDSTRVEVSRRRKEQVMEALRPK